MSDSKVHLLVRYEDNAAIADCLDAKLNEELSIQSWGDEMYALIENCKKERVIVNFQNVITNDNLPKKICKNQQILIYKSNKYYTKP